MYPSHIGVAHYSILWKKNLSIHSKCAVEVGIDYIIMQHMSYYPAFHRTTLKLEILQILSLFCDMNF